jgi:anti-anti-sigma factor
MKTTVREASGGVQIVDLKGKITIGAGDVQLRETINHLVEAGKKNILINMNDVTTIDSSGIRRARRVPSVTNKGGKLKLLPSSNQRRADRHAAHHGLRRLRVRAGGGGELRLDPSGGDFRLRRSLRDRQPGFQTGPGFRAGRGC